MRSALVLLPLLLALAPCALAAGAPHVTVYSHDLAFVRENRTLVLRGSSDTLRLEDVSTRLDFSSVRLAPASGRVARLAFRWDVASGDGVIEHAVGQHVRVLGRENRVSEGTLLAADGSWLVLRTDDGGLATLARASVEGVQLARAPQAFSLKPAIEAVLEGGHGATAAELDYLTGGMSWTAEHTLVRTGERRAVWSASVQVQNETGRDYVDAVLKLVAGEPARATPEMPKAMPMMMRAADAAGGAAAELSEAAFADYHLYTLDHPATLRDRETQSLVLLDPRPVNVTPRYVYCGGDPRGVLSRLELVNAPGDGPGAPLPAGRVRCFQPDDGGELQFTGESTIAHVAKGEKFTLDVGYAFDLAAERRLTSDSRPGERERVYQVEIRLRNRKSGAATITVEEPVGGDTQVIEESQPSTRKDAGTLQWSLEVPAGREVVLTYSARQRW